MFCFYHFIFCHFPFHSLVLISVSLSVPDLKNIIISILGITIPNRHRTGGYAKLAISLENSACDNSKSTEFQPEVCEKSTETTPSLCQYDLEDLEDDDEEFFYPDEINYYGEDDDTSSYYGEYNLQNHGFTISSSRG